MAQQPEKLRWKERVPYGLSASQFGAALGFSVGRVSDYVDYLRHVVGTSHEFRGNECTEHGIATESKSRCLYEMLTGIEVMDGGFFLSPEGLLGCSPDGLSYYYTKDDDDDDEQKKKSERRMCGPSTNNATCMPQKVDVHHNEEASCTPPTKQLCSFRIPFTRRKATHVDVPTPSPQSSPTTNNNNNNNSNNTHVVSATTFSTPPPTISSSSSSTTRASRPRLRCLEIKSPFRALYGANKTNHQPFGIPLVYMCQMQGQMAIAEADECDFFVFLNGPPTQVEAWRVRRSPHFWEWAYPKLLQVVQWVHEGPPTWLNRSFHFDHFDFSTICVEPLVFPYDISANMPLEDVRHYSFFCREPSPYAEDVGEVVAAWPTMSSRQRIAAMVRHPLVQQLFIPSEEASNDEDVEHHHHHHHRHCYEVDRSVSTILASQAACSSTHPWSGVPCAAVESGYVDAISVMSWDDGTVAMRWMMMNHSPQHHHIMNCNSQLLRCELRFFHRDLFSTLTPASVVPAPSTAPTTTTRRRSTGPWELESATCLSQQIRLSLTPQRRKVEAEEVAERAPSSTPPWMEPSTAHLVAPLQLTMGDLMELIDDAVDCREVIWVGAHDTPLRRWRTNRAATDALEEDLLYSLVVGPSEVVVELLCRPPASWALRWHATVEDLAASLVQSVQQHHVQDRAHAFVLCELREGNDSRPLDPLPIPRFVLFGADPPILRESIAARLQQHQECFS